MNLKTELIALAIRHLSDRTNLIRKPNDFDNLFSVLFTGKTYEVRLAEDIVRASDEVVESAKRFSTNRKFKKIVEHV